MIQRQPFLHRVYEGEKQGQKYSYLSCLVTFFRLFCSTNRVPNSETYRTESFIEVILTIAGRTDPRKKISIRIPNLATFTPLLSSVIHTSMGGTVNMAATFVIVINNSAREKFPPANKD